MAGRIEATTLLEQDHRRVEALAEQYRAATDVDDKTKLLHDIVHELAVHGEIEELLLYPRIRGAVPDGDRLADEAVHEHVEIKETLNELDRVDAADARADELLEQLMSEVDHHVREEESEVFPKIRQALTHDQLMDLGTSLQTAKSVVPTRPHPNAPTGPVGKLVAAPAASLVDRVRDAVRSFGDNRS